MPREILETDLSNPAQPVRVADEATSIPDWVWLAILIAIAAVVFWLIETKGKPANSTTK